jgi:hypothetical protein
MGGSATGSSFFSKVSSFFQDLFPSPELGDIWQGADASKAYKEGRLSSQSGDGVSLRLAFRNLSPVPLLLCWISDNGDLCHFYDLKPSYMSNDISIDEISHCTVVIEGDHMENTRGGHSFCLAYLPDENQRKKARRLKKLPDVSAIIGGYRPNPRGSSQLHLVTIGRGVEGGDEKVQSCCVPPRLRGKRRKVTFVHSEDEDIENSQYDSDDLEWIVTAQLAKVDSTPFDTSNKIYELHIIGGWPVYVEPNWFNGDSALEQRLADDLREACKILPSHAVEYLRLNCPIWVNNCIKYGPKACPVRGTGCCYHPDKNWLKEHGLSERKHMCVEINDGPGYKRDLDFWGRGGILVHELCHAYHHHMLPDGYDNKEIRACYKLAMKEKLYDKVKVHGPQGPEATAYACTNDKEYFAELSTAFLGCKDDSREYNKWYPFNREQLRLHDPRAYKLLSRLWKVEIKQ